MNEEKVEAKKESKGFPKWLLVVILIVVVVAIVGAWWLTRGNNGSKDGESTAATTNQATTKEPKHADWQKFTSSKYKFTMYYPADYTLAESAVGTLTLSKDSNVMVDLYVTVASASQDPVPYALAPYLDDARGYMTGATEVDTTATVDKIKATMVTGTLGAKAGITPQVGKKGSAIFFQKDDYVYVLDSFYNNNVADFQIFEDIIADIRF